ncbi:hypothetical protein [Chryseobacterium balustinum]|uniref:hypothetical protein n=1 Tax=Chryseobacterium balustinum TaxID=246 RepID=UPI000F4F1B43|nr:hypothetical protein [Chryseobacterium balustinum]
MRESFLFVEINNSAVWLNFSPVVISVPSSKTVCLPWGASVVICRMIGFTFTDTLRVGSATDLIEE